MIDYDDDSVTAAIGSMFGRYGQEYRVPSLPAAPIPDHLVGEMAEATGRDLDEILDLDYIDILVGLAESKVRTEAARLRLHAVTHYRADLLRSVRDVRAAAGAAHPEAGRHLRLVRAYEVA